MTTLSQPETLDSERLASLPRLPRDEGGPVFAEPWQAQAFALAVKLSEHCRNRPKGIVLHATGEFNEAVKNAAKAIKLIERIQL